VGPQSLGPGEKILCLVRQIHPAHALGRILGAVEELGVLLLQPRGQTGIDEPCRLGFEFVADRDIECESHDRTSAVRMVSCSSVQLTSNFFSPCSSSTVITSAQPMPSRARASKTSSAAR